jgi:haloacid dehalogenase-like hydrolase
MLPDLAGVAELEAVVTDLDGTIVRRDGTISVGTVAAVAALRAVGVPLIAATARTPAGICVLGPLLAEISAAVWCNGAIGLGAAGAGVLWQHWLAGPVVPELADFLAVTWPEAGLGSYDGSGWLLSPCYYADGVPDLGCADHRRQAGLLEVRGVGQVQDLRVDGQASVTYVPDRQDGIHVLIAHRHPELRHEGDRRVRDMTWRALPEPGEELVRCAAALSQCQHHVRSLCRRSVRPRLKGSKSALLPGPAACAGHPTKRGRAAACSAPRTRTL